MRSPKIPSSEDLPRDLERIAAGLGSAKKLTAAPPHDYPMSVPRFVEKPHAERYRPETDHLRLYVHIPFCNYACTFCFFSKRVGTDREQMERYVRALLRELEWVKPGTPLSQLFMGGGTPTCLPPDLLDEVLTAIFARMPQTGGKTHTVEASPESITPEHVNVLKKHKIGRVSMGIQSLEAERLDETNRRHTPEEALDACRFLIESGLIVNIDLIYGLPGQTQASFHRDLETVAKRGVPALTLYNLRVNERTPMARTIDDGQRWNLEKLSGWRDFVQKAASGLGYTQTRWHTFKRMDGIAAKHERVACFKDDGYGYQLGIGLSARSQLGYHLYRNAKDMKRYMERVESGLSPVEEMIPLSVEDRKTQFVARSIGDGKPLHRRDYLEAFGRDIDDDFGPVIRRLAEHGLLNDNGDRFSLSETGKLVYDLVTVCFYPKEALEWLETNKGAVEVE